MAMQEPSFTVGVEEEYLLVDDVSRGLASNPPPEFMKLCEDSLPGNVNSEFLRCQIEVGTSVCTDFTSVFNQLAEYRGTLAEKGKEFGLSPISVGTHPFAEWEEQRHTDKTRYKELATDMRVVASRMVICGMHVHVGIEDPALRIDIFNQMPYFLPHLLALSTSSPFWRGHNTGLKSYRLAVFNELPRTGLPPQFYSDSEYQRTLEILVNAKVIEDATKIWWDLRPSNRFPTLEMRVTDACTRVKDTVAIAALFRCLCRMLYRLRQKNQRWRQYSSFLLDENRWQSQKFGVEGSLFDYGLGHLVPISDLILELKDLIWEDAEFFGCEKEIEHAVSIVSTGTSADQQLSIFKNATEDGVKNRDAQKEVVEYLISETLRDC